MKLIKPIAKFTLVTQILFPLLFSATSVASAVNTKQEKINHREVLAKIQSNLPELTSKQTDETHSLTGDELLAQGLNKSAQIISQDNSYDAAKDLAQSTAYGFVSNQMTNWLNQYGNATIQISSDRAFSGEYFLPFYETEDNLFFSQSRIQRQNEDRTTLNLGLGYRYFITNKMWGVNSFYDHDLKNHNARWGLGAELGADYIKLAANGYFRLTDWRDSRLSAFHDYDERPANGFDIKAEGFLPSYPQLGANIKYEKYFGDKVNLKGSNSISDLKKDPQAYTVGISYTPVPLLSFSLNQSMGDVNETKGELAINYRFGVPLSQQLDTDLVAQMRTLMGARYNPVDRNNTIVMQYKKQDLLKIGFDKTLYELNDGKEETIAGPTIYKNKYKVAYVVYESINGLFSGDNNRTIETANYSVTFTPPKFNNMLRSASNNTYEVNAYAVDVNGNRSNTVKLTVNVVSDEENTNDNNDSTEGNANFSKSEFKASFGGKETSDKSPELTVTLGDKVTFTVTLNHSSGNLVKGKTVSIIYKESGEKACEEKDTDENGVYTCIADSPANDGTYEYRFTVNGQEDTSKTIKVTYELKEEEDDFSESEFKASFGGKETSDESPKLTVTLGDKVTFTVTLNNSSNSVKGKKVSIIYKESGEKACEEKDTDENGVYTCIADSPANDGTYEYRFTVNGQEDTSKTIKVDYKPIQVGPIDKGKSKIKLMLNGVEKHKVQLWDKTRPSLYVRLRDADDTPIELKSLKSANDKVEILKGEACVKSNVDEFDYVCEVTMRFGASIHLVANDGSRLDSQYPVYAGLVTFGDERVNLKKVGGVAVLHVFEDPIGSGPTVAWTWERDGWGSMVAYDGLKFGGVRKEIYRTINGKSDDAWLFVGGDYCDLLAGDCYSY